jgi:hypothetical protein
MASRYPLVVNNSTSLVGELPIGDSLNLSSSGIFDGISTGGNGEILSSNNGNIRWTRAADVFKDDTQTLKNKTLTNSVIDASLNTLTNVANANLLNSSITINGTAISLGGSVTIADTNDNTIYAISVADGVNSSQKRIRLTAGGSGSGVQDIFLTTGNYLSITRSNNDTLNFAISIQDLTAGSYIVYDNSATLYNGLNARTISVNATTTNTANRVVARDANGDFSARTITANLTGDVTGNVSGTAGKVANTLTRGTYLTGDNYDGSAARTWAVDAVVGTSDARGGNKIVARDSNGDFWARIINATTFSGNATSSDKVNNALSTGTYLTYGGTATSYDGSAARTLSVDATSNNTASKVVARDSNGDFSARIITANLNGSITNTSSNGYGNRTISNSEPGNSPGNEGDIWYVIK